VCMCRQFWLDMLMFEFRPSIADAHSTGGLAIVPLHHCPRDT
jgi:hypothetical protein